MVDWLNDLVWRYPITTRYILVVLALAYLVYLIDKVV